MLLEILELAIIDYIDKETKPPIEINLTPLVYTTLQKELNEITNFNTTVPIENIRIDMISIHGRTVTLVRSDKLDTRFESHMLDDILKSWNHIINNEGKNKEAK